MTDLSAYVGTLWRDRGRERDGCDCWGLVRIVYADVLGILLPSYGDDYATAEDRAAVGGLIRGEMGPWRPVADHTERPLDCVLIAEAGIARHVGIVAARGFMLHMPHGRESVMESYRAGRYRTRLAGFFRHADAP